MPSRRRRLIHLREELPSGLHPGIPFQQVPLWLTGVNVRFSETGPEKMKGWTNPVASGLGSVPVRGMGQNLDTFQQVYFGDQTTLRKWTAAGATTEGTGYTGSLNETVSAPATSWSFQDWGTWMVATNGVDALQIDKGAGFIALGVGGQISSAEVVLALEEHLVAFGTSINDKGYAWSDVDDIEDWVPTQANDAGDNVFREASSKVVAAVPLGNSAVAYTNEEIFIVSFIGGNNVFGHRLGAQGIGAISKHSVIAVSNKHYGWGRQGIFVTDGIGSQFIDQSVRDYLEANVNFSQGSKINGFHDEENHCVTWYYPSTAGAGEPDRGVSFDYEKNKWTLLDHGRSASIERNIFDYAITASPVGEVFFENFGADADGVALTASILSKGLDGDDPDVYKEIESTRIGFEGTGLEYRIGCQDLADDAITWTTWAPVASGIDFTDDRLSGRFIHLELRSVALGDTWNVSGIDVYGRTGGTR